MSIRLFIIFMFLGFWSFGQSYNYDLISEKDGLPRNRVYHELVDTKGYLWLATPRGVVKYDGHNTKIFNAEDGLSTNIIWNVWEDSSGRIWLYSFSKEVQFIEGDSVKTAFTKATTLFIDNFLEENGAIYTTDSKFKYCYKDGKATNTLLKLPKGEKHPTLLASNLVLTYNSNNTVSVWSLKNGLFAKIHAYTKENKPFFSRSPGKYFIDANYLFSFSSNNRILRWDWRKNQSIYFDLKGICEHGKIGATIFPYGDLVQVSSEFGCLILDKELQEVERIIPTNSIFNKNSGLVFKHRESLIEINTKKGIYLLSKQKKASKHFQVGDTKFHISQLDQGLNGNIILGLQDGSVYELSNNQVTKKIEKSSRKDYSPVTYVLKTDTTYAFHIGQDVKYYGKNFKPINTNKAFAGIQYKYGKKTIELLPKISEKQFAPDGIPSYSPIHSIYLNPKLNWTSYTSHDLCYIRKVTESGIVTIQAIKKNRQSSTVITNDSIIWFGGQNGLSSFRRDSLYIHDENKLLTRGIYNLLLDKKGNLWVATMGFGVYCYREGLPPVKVKGCEFDYVKQMRLGSHGDLWIATDNGLRQIKITTSPSLSAKVISTFTKHDGISHNSIFRLVLTDSLIYIASGNRLDVLPIEFSERKIILPKLYIDKYKINGQYSNPKKIASLPYTENNLSIIYSGVSLASKKALSYHYYIDNYTIDTLVTMENAIHLNNIASGNYKMTLFAQDDVGNRSKMKEISFSIGKPWYLQWWAFLIYFGLFAVFTYLFIVFRINKIRKTETTKKRISELELQALQSQLNPHFIFNALGAIQYYQNEQDVAEAEEYLGNFSQLMRLYLESSKKAVVPLRDELELIQLYIGLEKLRFEDKFSVEIDIEKELKFEHINIPSMVLQPFVENAINHGLFHKKEPGHLSIKIKKQKDQWIHVIVKDDGVGRAAAQKIAKRSHKNYKSRAMQIIEERLSIMNKGDDTDVKIVVKDLLEDGKPAGTEVDILLPLV